MMEVPVVEIEDDIEDGDVFDIDAPVNFVQQQHHQAERRPYLFINPHVFPQNGFQIMNLVNQQNQVVHIPHLHPNDKTLYSNGSWALLLRQGEVQSIMLLNLELSQIIKLPVYVRIPGGRIYAHNIKTGTFTGNVDIDDYVIYLVECPPAHQNVFVVWISKFCINLNDGDQFNNENDYANEVFLGWDRRIIQVQQPAPEAFSLIFWGQSLYWLVETGDVRCYNLQTRVNIQYGISPEMLFENDDDPHRPRAFLVAQDGRVLYISCPIIEENGDYESRIRVGELLYLEDNIGIVQRCVPSDLYIQHAAIFLNRGQGGVSVSDLFAEDEDFSRTVWTGPIPEECSQYILGVGWTIRRECELDSCEGIWLFSDDGNFCVVPWIVFHVIMLPDDNMIQEDDEEEQIQHEDDDSDKSSVITEEVAKLLQEGYKSNNRSVELDGCKKFSLIKPPSYARELFGAKLDVMLMFPHNKRLLDSYKEDGAIFCNCCIAMVIPSRFEAYASQASLHKLHNYIYISNGVSLHELSVSSPKHKTISLCGTDDLCSFCSDNGDLIICVFCPRAFHKVSVGLTEIPREDWCCLFCVGLYRRDNFVFSNDNAHAAGRVEGVDPVEPISESCICIIFISENDLGGCTISNMHNFSQPGIDDSTVLCDLELTEGRRFCSSDCSFMHGAQKEVILGGPQSLTSSDIELIRRNTVAKGSSDDDNGNIRRHFSKVSVQEVEAESLSGVVPLLHESFDPIIDLKTRQDLITTMVDRSEVLSAGLLHVFRADVTELPLVATGIDLQWIKPVLKGVIKGGNILCFCSACNGFQRLLDGYIKDGSIFCHCCMAVCQQEYHFGCL